MADLPSGGQGGLPQLPQDPGRINKFIQGVVQHNTLASGSKWPPQTSSEHMSASAQMRPPTPSPGGNIQPSPKDSGVDMNSPTHREDGVHVDVEHDDAGHKPNGGVCRLDSAAVDCVPYGPSSVESGAVVDSENQDIDPGGGGGTGGHASDVEPCITMGLPGLVDSRQQHCMAGSVFSPLRVPSSSSSVNSTSFTCQLSVSLPPEPHHHHHSQNIFEKFLTNPGSNNLSLAELNSGTHTVQSSSSNSHKAGSKDSLKKGDSIGSHLSTFGDSLLDLSAGLTSSQIFPPSSALCERSESTDKDSLLLGSQTGSTSKSYIFTPAKDLSMMKSAAGSSPTFNAGLTPPSNIATPLHKTPSTSTLYRRTKSSESLGLGSGIDRAQVNELFNIDLLEDFDDSDDDWDCKLECAADNDSGPDSPPVLQPIGPVPVSRSQSHTPSSHAPSRQKPGFSGSFSPGYLGEFAKFLKKSTQPLGAACSKRSPESTKVGRAIKGSHCLLAKGKRHSVAGDSTANASDMLPVLKLRKLSAGNYATVQSTSPPVLAAAESVTPQKPPRLKIKYGSPEMGDMRQVVDVHYKQSPTSELSEDEYVLKDAELDVSDRLSSRTLSPPVLHMEQGIGEELGASLFNRPACVRQQKQGKRYSGSQSHIACKCCAPTPLRTKGEHFNMKTFLAWHSKVAKLRRKVLRLCKVIFPSLSYPQRFSREGPQVEALLDQMMSAVKDDRESPHAAGKHCALPTGDPCCWEVNVVMCKSPRICLQHLRAKICQFMETLLPGLQLGPEFDRGGDLVDELLHRVFTANRQKLKEEVTCSWDVT